jgi:hypothetical protein
MADSTETNADKTLNYARPADTKEIPAPIKAIVDTYNAGTPIVAKAGRYYRNARYIMAVGVLAVAAWFGYDGWVGYPAKNRAIAEAQARGEKPSTAPKSEFDIRLQQQLAMGLPFLSVAILSWMLYRSRGEYRLENDVLHVPGHPPVGFDAFRAIDRSRWDKKGIARIEYETPEGTTGTATLDDFVYQQDPTDAIFAVIESRLAPAEEPAAEESKAENA